MNDAHSGGRRAATFHCAVLLATLLIPASAAAQDAPTPATAEGEVLAVVEASLERISAEDMAGFADLMADGAIVAAVGPRGLTVRTRAEERAATVDADYVERGFDAEVRVSGPVAMVWLPYDFYLDGEWSHCGVDIFTLARGDDGWRIVSVTYSVEQPPACRRHPDGPPAR